MSVQWFPCDMSTLDTPAAPRPEKELNKKWAGEPIKIDNPERMALDTKKKSSLASRERFRRWIQDRLLLDLVALEKNSCCERFRMNLAPAVRVPPDQALLEFRDQLRIFWANEDKRFELIQGWLQRVEERKDKLWIVGTFRDGAFFVDFNYWVFEVALAVRSSELSSKMGICENPNCAEKYFLKRRFNQRFCERSDCVEYGQKAQKREWWNSNKKDLLAKRRIARRASRSGRH